MEEILRRGFPSTSNVYTLHTFAAHALTLNAKHTKDQHQNETKRPGVSG